MLHSEYDCLHGFAGREQVRPRGGRIRQSVFAQPRRQPVSRAGRIAPVASAAAGGSGSRRENRDSRASPIGSPGKPSSATRRCKRPWTRPIERAEEHLGVVAGHQPVGPVVGSRVPPFPMVRESITGCRGGPISSWFLRRRTKRWCREWKEHNLDGFAAAICGQEIGTKEECLGCASQYPPGHALMIGDAPGDYKAAKANDALFYPINPGDEESSWQRSSTRGSSDFSRAPSPRLPAADRGRVRPPPARVAALAGVGQSLAELAENSCRSMSLAKPQANSSPFRQNILHNGLIAQRIGTTRAAA